jgi:hypothetical protein
MKQILIYLLPLSVFAYWVHVSTRPVSSTILITAKQYPAYYVATLLMYRYDPRVNKLTLGEVSNLIRDHLNSLESIENRVVFRFRPYEISKLDLDSVFKNRLEWNLEIRRAKSTDPTIIVKSEQVYAEELAELANTSE